MTQLGLLSFFIANYYQVQELSISFWVDMISLLKSESFTGLVFDGGIKNARKQTKKLVTNLKFKKVKDDLKTIKSAPVLIKLFYPFRVPFFVALGIFYFLLLVAFLFFLSVFCIPVNTGSQGELAFDQVCVSHFQFPTFAVDSILLYFCFSHSCKYPCDCASEPLASYSTSSYSLHCFSSCSSGYIHYIIYTVGNHCFLHCAD